MPKPAPIGQGGTLPPPPKTPAAIEPAEPAAGEPAEDDEPVDDSETPKPKGSPVSDAENEESGDGEVEPGQDKTPLPGDDGKTSNPLNPAGDDLQKLIDLRINEDLWKQVRGRLPCADPTQQCIDQLQNLAVQNAKPLKAVDERIQLVEDKIAEATANNAKTVKFGAFEPVLTEWLKVEPATATTPAKGGLISSIIGAIARPETAINQILSLIGIPLFRNATGTDSAAQTRTIAIADLSAKVATLKQERAKAADTLRERVAEELLAFDDARREFQSSQEISKREGLRLKILEVEYRLGQSNTAAFLGNQSGLDQRQIETYRSWSRVRSRLMRLKLLALGTPDETE